VARERLAVGDRHRAIVEAEILQEAPGVAWEDIVGLDGAKSALLEAVNDARAAAALDPATAEQHCAGGPIVRLGLPDRFVEHGERGELLAALGLDAAGIAATCRRLAGRDPLPAMAQTAVHSR
jgi:deoxyxylulose-5-phosphate synthase